MSEEGCSTSKKELYRPRKTYFERRKRLLQNGVWKELKDIKESIMLELQTEDDWVAKKRKQQKEEDEKIIPCAVECVPDKDKNSAVDKCGCKLAVYLYSNDDNNAPKNESVECKGFSACEPELEEIMGKLAEGKCGCSEKYIDMFCVKKTIESFEIDQIVICPGCFYGSGGQMSHYCVSAELLGLEWSKKIEEAVLREDRFKELIRIYCMQHEIIESETKSQQFKAGIELLLEAENYNLGFELCQKDQASYYRLRETEYEKSKRETAELWDSLTNW
jgi:hypothetical protein